MVHKNEYVNMCACVLYTYKYTYEERKEYKNKPNIVKC